MRSTRMKVALPALTIPQNGEALPMAKDGGATSLTLSPLICHCKSGRSSAPSRRVGVGLLQGLVLAQLGHRSILGIEVWYWLWVARVSAGLSQFEHHFRLLRGCNQMKQQTSTIAQ